MNFRLNKSLLTLYIITKNTNKLKIRLRRTPSKAMIIKKVNSIILNMFFLLLKKSKTMTKDIIMLTIKFIAPSNKYILD